MGKKKIKTGKAAFQHAKSKLLLEFEQVAVYAGAEPEHELENKTGKKFHK